LSSGERLSSGLHNDDDGSLTFYWCNRRAV
jgi:hypothetical protein